MENYFSDIETFLASPIPSIALILLLTILGYIGLRILKRYLNRRVEARDLSLERTKRLKTLSSLVIDVLVILLVIASGLMILNELEINIAPLLAGVGIAGLAITMASQTFIKDFIGGALILVENQFTIGDTISVDSYTGTVEDLGMRTTSIRDCSGKLHIIPNGEIGILTNHNVEWRRAIVDVNLPFDTDINRVMGALGSACELIGEDDTIRGELLEAPNYLGWVEFKDWAVTARLDVKVRQENYSKVIIALRKYVQEALVQAGIHTALPFSN
jgi:small-conductance mechanosensitive channel